MKKATNQRKKRPRKKFTGRGPRRQSIPLYEPISQREKETVIDLITGGQTAEKALEVGLSALIWADHTLAQFDWGNELPRPIVCTEGCDHCCFNQVELTPPEALVIGHFVQCHFPPEELERLLARAGESLQGKAGKSQKEIARIRQELPCPLLRGGKCSVYPVRPMVCRAMHSLDAGQCASSLQAGDLASGAYYSQRHELVWAIARGLLAGCRAMGCQSATLDLAQALQDYFRQPDPMAQWIRGETLFNF